MCVRAKAKARYIDVILLLVKIFVLLFIYLYLYYYLYYCCVSIQALHPSEAFEGQLCHNATRSLSQSEDSLFLEDAALRSFMASHVPRFFAGLKKTKEKEKMATLHCIDRDVRVKHLVTQPGTAPKARPSHLTAADEVNKVSEGLAFKDHKGRVLQRTQT